MLQLSRLGRADVVALHALIQRNREHLCSLGDFGDLIERNVPALTRQLADEETWGLHYPDLIGSVSLIHYQPRVAGLGYWIAAEFQGQGLMTEAVRQVINTAFTERHINEFWAGIKPVNAASIAVVRKLGFEQVRSAPTHQSYRLVIETQT